MMQNGPFHPSGLACASFPTGATVSSRFQAADRLACDLRADEFCRLLGNRQLLVSEDGASVAQLQRQSDLWTLLCQGCEGARFHASDARLLRVQDGSALVWARRLDAQSGLYELDASGRLTLRQRLEAIRPGKEGSGIQVRGAHVLLAGRNETDPSGSIRHVAEDDDFLRPSKDLVDVTDDGTISVLSPSDDGDRWTHETRKAGIGSTRFMSEIPGLCRAYATPWRGGFTYTFDEGGQFLVAGPGRKPDPPHEGRLRFVWGSSESGRLAHLVRHESGPQSLASLEAEYGPRHELLVDGRTFHRLDGYYRMEPGDFRWGHGGHAFGALIRRLQHLSDGAPFLEEALITSAGRTFQVPAHENLREWAVDDDGEAVALVLSDGENRRLLIRGKERAAHPYIWNLRLEENAVAANILEGREISRMRFDI